MTSLLMQMSVNTVVFQCIFLVQVLLPRRVTLDMTIKSLILGDVARGGGGVGRGGD